MNNAEPVWTREQIAALEPGAPVNYMGLAATVERIVARGDNHRGEPYKVVEARWCETSTITTGVAAGEPISHSNLRPAQ